MSKKLVYLPNRPEVKLYQDDEMFCINTDTQVLGEFLNIYRDDIVLDFGTNNGALLLYANKFKPRKLIGVDINSQALKLAEENLIMNKITNFELYHCDILNYKNDEVDVIICNPPYFKTPKDNKCLNNFKALAKYENDLLLEKLILSIRRNLKNQGTLFFLYQSSRLSEVMAELRKNHFKVKLLKFVYDINKEYSNIVLIKAVKGAKDGMLIEKPIIIERR